jgi:hypothetical protein
MPGIKFNDLQIKFNDLQDQIQGCPDQIQGCPGSNTRMSGIKYKDVQIKFHDLRIKYKDVWPCALRSGAELNASPDRVAVTLDHVPELRAPAREAGRLPSFTER